MAVNCCVAFTFNAAEDGVTPTAVMVGAVEPPDEPPVEPEPPELPEPLDELLEFPAPPQPASKTIERISEAKVKLRDNDIVWIGP